MNSVQAATKEGVVLKCGQVMQKDNCNNMCVSSGKAIEGGGYQ
jgi:hypothetical protein